MIKTTTGPTEGIAPRGTIYIPIVSTGYTEEKRCFDDAGAKAFFDLVRLDSRQQRSALVCCESLVMAARWRAQGLATIDPWAHVDAAGVTPNEYARGAGCVLPDNYADIGNNIEILVAGTDDPQAAFDALANSPLHAKSMFGEVDFFRVQGQCGIAMAEGGAYGWYWVIMIAICEGAGDGQ